MSTAHASGFERIAQAFASTSKRAALMPYVMGGFPTLEASLRIESLDSALPDLLALGAEVEVLAPPTLRRLVAETAQQVASLHAGPTPH